MATVEEKASPEAAEGAGERYRYVIEKPASGEYRNVQAERAAALDRIFEGKDKLPQSLLDDIADEDFFVKGQVRQQAGEVKRLIPDRFFADDEAKREVNEVLEALRGGRSLDELQDDALLKDGKYDVGRLEALKLVGARLLQEHRPEARGKNWDEISEEEKRTVRLGEMMIHQAEMMALDRRLEEKKQAVPVEVARVFEKNYAEYAKNVDISEEQRESYRQMARFLRERVPELSGKKEELELTPIKEEELDLTPKGGAEGAESEEVLGGEGGSKPAEESDDAEDVLGAQVLLREESGQETTAGAAAGDTAVVKEVQESTGERPVKEIEGEMRSVYRRVREIGGAGSGPLGEKVSARKQPELEGLRRRWSELRDEMHTRAARERLQSSTVDWLEKAEREVEGILSVPPGLAEEWAEEHDWEEKGRVEREERKSKAAPYVKRGKKLKPLRKRGTKKKQGGV